MNIYFYPQAELLGAWVIDRALFCPDAEEPIRCLRCGGLLRSRLEENALSRALDVHICPACGMDEALRDANGMVLPVREWWAVREGQLEVLSDHAGVALVPTCEFSHIFTGPQKKFPLSSLDHPVSELAYSRSDYDGHKWWTTWYPCQDKRATGALAEEIDDFQASLLALPEFQTLWSLRRMCRNYAEITREPTEFNLYGETSLLYVWLRLITRERDYNLYCHFYQKDGGARTE